MKTKFIFTILLLGIACNYIYGQGFQPPSSGKAVVYFVRTAGHWKDTYFFFHQNHYIGEFKHKDYLRYECSPGKQLFWGKSENFEFINADLKEGGTYIIHVDLISPGLTKYNIGFTPITFQDKERFDPCKKLILSKGPVIQTPSYIEKMNQKMKKTIDKSLDSYEKEWKNTRNFKHISQEMSIPIEEIK